MLPFLSRPTRGAFAQHARDRLLRWRVAAEVRYEPEQFRLVLAPSSLVINLDNLYRDYCAASIWRRNAVLRGYLLPLLQMADHRPPARDELVAALRPMVRDDGYIASARAQLGGGPGKEPALILRPLVGPYHVQLVLDLPTSMRSVSADEIAAAGLGADEAHELALRNLQAVEARFVELGPGLWASHERDCYDGARLLLVHRLRRLAERAVVVPVHRNELLIADPAVPGALARLAQLAEAHADEDRAIALVPLQLGPDGWTEFLPPAGEEGDAVRRLLTIAWLRLYEEQRERLIAAHERDGVDVFVASFTAVEGGNGRVRSYAVWSPVPSLLPRTDLVACIAAENAEPTLYRWDDVMARCGHLLRRTEHQPPRWATTGPPDPALLAGLEGERL